MTIAKPALAIQGNWMEMVIDGHVEGVVAHHQKQLTVSKSGRVNGQVCAGSVRVLGQVFGEIRSDGIVFLATGCNVEGGIVCPRIVIENGAIFEGSIEMSAPP